MRWLNNGNCNSIDGMWGLVTAPASSCQQLAALWWHKGRSGRALHGAMHAVGMPCFHRSQAPGQSSIRTNGLLVVGVLQHVVQRMAQSAQSKVTHDAIEVTDFSTCQHSICSCHIGVAKETHHSSLFPQSEQIAVLDYHIGVVGVDAAADRPTDSTSNLSLNNPAAVLHRTDAPCLLVV